MSKKTEFGSHFAMQGSYGDPIANNPGEGCGYHGSNMKGGKRNYDPPKFRGKDMRNSPGKGAGHQGTSLVKRPKRMAGSMRMGD